jgi:dTDP-4-dehydrorhamnose reductase
VAASRDDADLDRPDSLRVLVRRVRPSVVVNAAAYTAVDDAEVDRDRCLRVNATSPGVLAEEAARVGAPIVHYSTNYVFDGTANRPYTEADPVSPISVYGESKVLGESAVADANPAHFILRTSAIYGWKGKNFLLRILELAAERKELRVVDDQLVSPTPAATVAAATVRVLERLLAGTDGPSLYGTYNLTAWGAASWHDFAKEILALDPDRERQQCRTLFAIPSTEFPTPARRPANGVLDNTRFSQRFGFSLPGWERALRDTFTKRESSR